MSQIEVPSSLGEITPSWLSSALQDGGSVHAAVSRVTPETIAVGEGFAGTLARLRVEYEAGSPRGPATLIAKLPAEHPPTRTLLTTLGAYEREIRFYQVAASETPLRTPRCFLAQWDPDSSGFVLLLEDLGHLRSQDQVDGCPVGDLEVVVAELAKFHASYWENPVLEDWPWAPRWDMAATMFGQAYPAWWRGLKQRFPVTESGDFQRVADLLGSHVVSIKTQLARPPVTLSHGDYRLENMFFDDADSGSSLVVFDWQAMRVGRAPYDLAYFLGTSVTTEDRRAHQANLKSMYYQTLVDAGVRNYTRGDFDQDFDYALLDIVSFTVLIGANLNFDNIQGQRLVSVYISRLSDALSEIDAERVLAELV